MKSAIIALTLIIAASAGLTAADRVALVVGCANYQADPGLTLDTPLNDMNDFSRTLQSPALGFEVTRVSDATRDSFDEGLKKFAVAARASKVALVFFSGHGIEHSGQNYLITTNATLASAEALPTETMPLDRVITALSDTKAQVKIAILDCCRDNPFAATKDWTQTKSWRATKSVANDQVLRQLGEAEIPEATLLCFATGAGRKAAAVLDSSSVRSPFTDLLIKELPVPGQSLRDIFEHVHDALKVETAGRQVPTVQTDNALSEVFRNTVLVKRPAAATSWTGQTAAVTVKPSTDSAIPAAKPRVVSQQTLDLPLAPTSSAPDHQATAPAERPGASTPPKTTPSKEQFRNFTQRFFDR